jgi:hypothetical protein
MPTLPLAVDIADIVTKAANGPEPLNIDAAADALLEAHPEADVARDDVVLALVGEGAVTGAVPPKPASF